MQFDVHFEKCAINWSVLSCTATFSTNLESFMKLVHLVESHVFQINLIKHSVLVACRKSRMWTHTFALLDIRSRVKFKWKNAQNHAIWMPRRVCLRRTEKQHCGFFCDKRPDYSALSRTTVNEQLNNIKCLKEKKNQGPRKKIEKNAITFWNYVNNLAIENWNLAWKLPQKTKTVHWTSHWFALWHSSAIEIQMEYQNDKMSTFQDVKIHDLANFLWISPVFAEQTNKKNLCKTPTVKFKKSIVIPLQRIVTNSLLFPAVCADRYCWKPFLIEDNFLNRLK